VLANFALSGAGAPNAAGPKPFSMELKQLDYFLGVAESGSFSKAAIRLSVAQPILSRQIKLLESELGVELLYRNGRGVVVSEADKVLENYARSVVGLVEKADPKSGP
jgi:LysR family nitrogen assimilation transcriptional regulator